MLFRVSKKTLCGVVIAYYAAKFWEFDEGLIVDFLYEAGMVGDINESTGESYPPSVFDYPDWAGKPDHWKCVR